MGFLPQVRGMVNFLVIRARASDIADFPVPTFVETTDIALALCRYWNEISRGALSVTAHVHPRDVVVPQTAKQLADMSRNAIGDAVRAAAPEIDGADFPVLVALLNAPCGGGAAGGDVIAGLPQARGQRGWAWCSVCQALAFADGSREPGRCPGGGRHQHDTSGRYLAVDQSGPGVETGWRWCSRCEGLVRSSEGACTAGGSHDTTGSGAYAVATNGDVATQSGWTRCDRCAQLVFGGGGPCAAGGQHQPVGVYFATVDPRPDLSFFAHETGHALGLDHAFDDRATPIDPGDDSRPGAYGDRWDIMSFSNTASHRTPELGLIGPGLSAPTLYRNGWTGDDRVWRHPGAGSATVELASTSEPDSKGLLLAVVPVPSSGRVYSVEYRSATGWDQGAAAGVLIRDHRAPFDTPSLGLLSQNGWRWCKRCSTLVFRGHRACAPGREHVSDGSALAVPHQSAPGRPAQSGWAWCSRCQSLVNEAPGSGLCPAAGHHDTGASGPYFVEWAPGGGSDSAWRWCSRCHCLNHPDSAGNNRCLSGEYHANDQSGRYLVPPLATPGSRQPGWTRCRRCAVLFFDRADACAAGGGHDTAASDDFFLAADLPWAPGQHGWRWCRNCNGLAYLDPGRGAGRCPAGGRHDHSGSGNYAVESPRSHDSNVTQGMLDEVQQQGWGWCRRCEQLAFGGAPTRCPAGGAHDLSSGGSYLVRKDVAGHGDQGRLVGSTAWPAGSTMTSADGALTIRVLQADTQPTRITLAVEIS